MKYRIIHRDPLWSRTGYWSVYVTETGDFVESFNTHSEAYRFVIKLEREEQDNEQNQTPDRV